MGAARPPPGRRRGPTCDDRTSPRRFLCLSCAMTKASAWPTLWKRALAEYSRRSSVRRAAGTCGGGGTGEVQGGGVVQRGVGWQVRGGDDVVGLHGEEVVSGADRQCGLSAARP